MPEPTPDANKIAAELVIAAIDRTIGVVAQPAQAAIRRIRLSLFDAYRPFLEQTYLRVKTIKTFLRPNEPIDLLDNYVSAQITDGRDEYGVEHLVEQACTDGRTVISGVAGRGKSVLMRYIALSMYHSPRGKIPLFIELRALNSLTSKELIPYIHAQYKGNTDIALSEFLDGLSKGYFSLLLDGFDEIDPSARNDVEAQILAISQLYLKCPIIISGRPDDRFESWNNYRVMHVCSMNYKTVRELITRSDYDTQVKKLFLKRLTPDFFAQHESFLGTPLLAIMLMLSFEEYAEIPTSLHVFYRNAFDTLVRRHDAMKSQFLRTMHSPCTAEQFRKVFSSFCLLTYAKSKFQFSHDEVLDFLKKSLDQQQVEAKAELVLSDLVESICLLQKEGFEITFVHRSFQEYFCALFVAHSPTGVVEKYLESANIRVYDNVIPMIYGMAPERVESEWANKTVSALCARYKKPDLDRDMRFILDVYPNINLGFFDNTIIHFYLDETPESRTVSIINRLYPAFFLGTGGKRNLGRRSDKTELAEWRKQMMNLVHEMARAGDPRLKNLNRNLKREQGDISFPVTVNDRRFLEKLGMLDFASNALRAFEAIEREQKKRIRSDDAFLDAVFSPAE